MTYRGKVENGHIVLDGAVALPEGARVSVVVDDAAGAGEAAGAALSWIAGHAADSGSCPADLAREHDHYLYGTPKRSG